METVMRLILDGLYCLVALCACGFFMAMIYTDIKKDQRDEEMAWQREEREEREEEYHRKQMESFRN